MLSISESVPWRPSRKRRRVSFRIMSRASLTQRDAGPRPLHSFGEVTNEVPSIDADRRPRLFRHLADAAARYRQALAVARELEDESNVTSTLQGLARAPS